MTREQIEALRGTTRLVDNDGAYLSMTTVELLDLALLGLAVRESGVTAKECRAKVREYENSRGSLSLTSPVYSNAYALEIKVFDALAKALSTSSP